MAEGDTGGSIFSDCSSVIEFWYLDLVPAREMTEEDNL